MARKSSKQHICEECGESFGHGISLRRHQRKTGHSGSRVVDEGDDAPEPQPAAAQPAAPPPQPEPEPAPPPPQPAAAQPAPQPAAQAPEPEPAPAAAPAAQAPTPEPEPEPEGAAEEPTVPSPTLPPAETAAKTARGPRIDTKKLSILGHGLSILAAHHAKRAKNWASDSAKSSAPVLKESVKLAAIILLALTIPVTGYLIYRGQHRPIKEAPTYASQISQISEAKASVLRFYQAIDQGKLGEAYELLSRGWQKEISFEDFRDGFRNARAVGCRIENIAALDENQVQVEFALEMREDGTPKSYRGNYVVVRTSSGWRIDRGEIKLTRSEGYRHPSTMAAY